ncbi:MAG: long-chain-fatty-acid--CoA ligase [Actinobacteria bacterium]|nr:long-chain-fatty-acid--CoA ligase [Actinomycetota bacterium]
MSNAVYFTPLTPLSFLDRSARVFPDKTAIVYGARRRTYAQFAADATRLARALQANGVAPGDRVAYLLPNLPEMLVAHFGVPLAGGVLLALNTRLSALEIGYILDHSAAQVLVVDSGFLPIVPAALADAPGVRQVVVLEDDQAAVPFPQDAWDALGDKAIRYADYLATGSDEPLPWAVEDEMAPLALNYTSGTTGKPKGVVYHHRGAYLNSFGEIIHSAHTSSSVYLWTLPMFHCNGWCTPWAVTAIGGTHVCLREVRGDVIWQLIDEHGITHLNGAPTVVSAIMFAPERRELAEPVIITTAGAPPAPTTILQMEQMGFGIRHVYGLTEVYGPYTVCEPQESWASLEPAERARVQSRQGVGMIQTDPVRVVDAAMNDVPADGETMGEIVMRGNNVMLGYYLDEQGTRTAFEGGWFHSGDLGVMHPDGYIELRDRAKDVVISGGENISTVEVEQALMSHPAVLEVAVVGVPDEKWGERPKAFVVTHADKTATVAELIEHVRTQIAHYKAPRDIDFLVELPKTSTGKIQKFQLREAEWAGREKLIH